LRHKPACSRVDVNEECCPSVIEFLSLTFTDLVEHRKTVQSAIRQLGAIDVSMENFGALEERPADECIRLV
jgi:hypothetical protein